MSHIPKLKKLRAEARLSQARLARLADVDRATVSAAENGKNCQELKCRMIMDGLNKGHFKAAGRELDADHYIQDGGITAG